jgi:hypothetical protein
MSYSSDTSLELRWIFEGKIPVNVENWFYKGLDSIGDPKEPPYEDIYLFNPEVDYSSVKFREDKLDIKWRRNSFQINLEERKNKISGIVEGWVFWEWKEKKTADEIREFMDDNKKHPWLKVNKERSRIRYKINSNDGDGSLKPTQDEKNANCSIELVKLQIKENKKNLSWWSLGLDLFVGKKVSDDEKRDMKAITDFLLKDYPTENDNDLNSTHSYAYPKLFSMNVDSIK